MGTDPRHPLTAPLRHDLEVAFSQFDGDWGLKLAERGGKSAKKRAAVAVARKLSVLLLRLWATGEVYEPLRNARKNDELLPTPA